MSDRANVLQTEFDHAYAALAEEHEQIMAQIELLESDPKSSKLIERLERLHNLLIDHFAREQFPGGLYEAMGAFGSPWHGDLKELIREHCVILSEARSLLEQARIIGPDERPGLHPKVIALIRQLSEHEHKEHLLAARLRSKGWDDHS